MQAAATRSLMLFSRASGTPSTALLAHNRSTQKALRRFMGGGGHGPMPPTFVRLPPPNKPVHEESELVWHDGVAPELTIDFDAPEVSKLRGLGSWLTGLGFFASLMVFIKFVWDPPSMKPVADRVVEVGDALGGYPNPRRAAKKDE